MLSRTRYRQVEHTADVKVEIYGRDLGELFSNACFCIFDVMLDSNRIRGQNSAPVSLESRELPELFMDWLRELLFHFSTRSFAVAGVAVADVDERHINATLFGEPFDLERHGLKVELKAPTYHQFSIEKSPDGYRATVVFDA